MTDAHDPEPSEQVAAQAVALMTGNPAWAIWLPVAGGEWIAVRPASSRPPRPGLLLLWARAATAGELARKMRALDEQVAPGGWP
jgi:hypothetical protein